jgi:hypothetical protein
MSKLKCCQTSHQQLSFGFCHYHTLASSRSATFHVHANWNSAFKFWDSQAKDLPVTMPSILLNLQLTCSYLHDNVTQILYDKNEFCFSCPDSLEHFLLCLQAGPLKC